MNFNNIPQKNFKDCFASLQAQKETIENFKTLDIIIGHDTDTGNIFPVSGTNLLQTIASGTEAQECTIQIIDLRQATNELEMLIAAVRVAKGHDEYQSEELDEMAESTLNDAEIAQPMPSQRLTHIATTQKLGLTITDGMHRTPPAKGRYGQTN